MERSIDVRQTFKQCMTCSRTYCHLVNEYFDGVDDAIEKACDPLAGGLMNQGHQCGMLWGSTLALGKKSVELHTSRDKAISKAVYLAQNILESFEDVAGSQQCRDIIDIDLSKTSGMLKFIIKTTLQGTNNNKCFQLAEDWYPDVVETITITLEDEADTIHDVETCSSRLMYMINGTKEEEIMVSGWGGGIGLSGNACGVLATAIWKVTKEWCDLHPGQNPPYFTNRSAKRLLKAFMKKTEGVLKCRDICGMEFNDLEHHSDYIKSGGCEGLIDILADIVNKELRILKLAS